MSVEMSYPTSDQRSPITAIAGTSITALSGSTNSPNTIHPSEWSLQQVIQWLQSLQPTSIANQHASKFREHGIEGDVLLELDTEALGDMGISSIGHRLAILRGVYELKKRWNIELEPDSWRPDVQSISEGRMNNSALSAYSFLSSSSNGTSSVSSAITPQSAIADLVRALYERDERLWTLEQEVARLFDWLVRYTDDSTHSAKTIEALRPYLPPSKPPSNLSYIAQSYLRERQSGSGNGNLQVHGNNSIGSSTDVDGSGSSSGRGSKTPMTAAGFRSVHDTSQSHSPYSSAPGNASQTGFSPTTSTPGATPTNAHPPISIANDASKSNPMVTTTFVPGSAGGLSASSSGTLSGSLLQASPPSALGSNALNSNTTAAGTLTANTTGTSLSPSSPFSVGSNDSRKEKKVDSAGLTSASGSGTSGSAGPSKATDLGSSTSGSGGSAADTPYKSFRVTLDDPCYKVLPAALKKYKIDDDWRQYALFICYGSTERCLSYDEKPLLLFQKLKENKQSPVFMLRHIRDVKSPIAIASAKAAARKTSTSNGSDSVNGENNENSGKSNPISKTGVSKVADAVAKFGGTGTGKDANGNDVGGGGGGDKGQDSGAFVDSIPGQPRLTGPAAHLIDGKTTDGGGRGAASAASASGSDTYAIAIYPYVSEREDEFDVAVGDTFIVKSKAKGWWVVQRDARAKGHPIVEGVVRNSDGTPKNGGEIKSGWVPAGCLLETRQPLSTIVTLPQGEGGDPVAASVLNSPTSPKTPQAGSRMEDGQAKELASFMASVPIPPSLITSTSTPGILLMDYNNHDEKLHLKKDQRLRVFKRYNHWSYCVEEGGSHTRAWLPSWYIGKVGGSSRSGTSSSVKGASQSSSATGANSGNNTVPLTI